MRTVLPAVIWAATAGVGGLLLDLSHEGAALWWLTPVAICLLLLPLWQKSIGAVLLGGFSGAAAFWLLHINWLTLYLGPIPWLALAGVMVLWHLLFSFFASRLVRLTSAIGLQAAGVAGLWVAKELVEGSFPYGGFSWARIYATQGSSPLLEAVSWFGVAGSGFILVFCSLLLALGLREYYLSGRRRRKAFFSLGSALCGFLILALLPAFPLSSTGSLNIGAAQGNARAGIFQDRESGDVFRDHLASSYGLIAEMTGGNSGTKDFRNSVSDGLKPKDLDLLVWPENAAEFQATRRVPVRAALAQLASEIEAPVLVGSILQEADADLTVTNSAVLFNERGWQIGRYDKLNPVPFGEYMPNREFFNLLVPDLVSLVQLDYKHGDLPAALKLPNSPNTALGVAICFDMVFDRHSTAMLQEKAQVFIALTNNADFGDTDENAQQVALMRLQAVAAGRAMVNVSTVGYSEIIDKDGSVLAHVPAHTAGGMAAQVPLYDGATPAMIFGGLFALLSCLLPCGVFGGALFKRIKKAVS
ncbi:apolipoprotein N-acyltransferase [Canibacter zhoujuaniae]|uniref:apolipoprotein N-acyltransferase n=1 Tax=Canibacter zhoujuaniae TaxID=2708343 RepID=UPI0014219164|nr:apolipoprotein N-acyltransferase [Canibacter zhoujuaniae]